jgi:hypothetical protein
MSEAALRQSWQGKLATAPNGEAARKVVVEITRDLGAQPETEAWVSVVIAEKFVDSGDWVRTWFTKERTRLAVEARAAEITRGLEQRLAQAQSQANVVPTPKVPPAAVAKPERSEKDIGRGMERAAAERAVLSFLPTTQPKIDPEREHKAARLAEIMAGLDREKMAGLSKPDEDDEINVEAETVIVDEDLDDTVVTALPAVQGEILLPVSAAPAVQVGLLNQKHAVIGNYGGKCAVLAWERWNIKQKVMVPVFQTMTDFRNRYMNRYVVRETEDGITKTAAGKFWLSHPKRVTYDAVAFEPGQGEVLPGNRLNLWRDFSVRPKKGCWKRLRSHIYRVLGNGDRKAGRYIVRWLAWTLQNPGRQAEAVVVFQGEEGAGKGTLARALLKIFGPNGLPVSDAKLLVGSFSGHLHYCVFMFVDEAFWAGDVASEGRLKALITEEQITIEPKYFTAFPIPNNLHIIMSSNND